MFKSTRICALLLTLGLLACSKQAPKPVVAEKLTAAPSSLDTFRAAFSKSQRAGDKPTRFWVAKTLDKLVAVRGATRGEVSHYLKFETKAEALARILADHPEGFRERFYEFGLRFIEFMPASVFEVDALTHERKDSIELHAFTNVKKAADEVWQGGNFFTLLDFPWDDLVQQGTPIATSYEERVAFQEQFLNKPFHRVLTTSPNNRNRKRAGWFLRNFMCDDLTPSDAGAGAGDANADKPPVLPPMGMGLHGVNNRHATEVSCRVCHWKLDYVGAFFRYLGTYGESYRDKGKFIKFFNVEPFRDASWDAFMGDWKHENGKWAAGIRQGSLVPSPRDWNAGEEFSDPTQVDLFNHMKTMPDFHRCLTRKMLDLFLEDGRSYDSNWMESLASRYNAGGTTSGEVFLRNLGDIFLSRAFSAVNPDPSVCYDESEGGKHRLIPCQIARILDRRCAGCHRDTSLSIDVTDLVKREDGRLWFNHVDGDNKPMALEKSYDELIRRLTSKDSEVRMPYGQQALPAEELNALTQWLAQVKEGKL